MADALNDFALIEKFMVWKVERLTGKKNAELPREIQIAFKSRTGTEKPDEKTFNDWVEKQARLSHRERQEYSLLKRIAETSKNFKHLGGTAKDQNTE